MIEVVFSRISLAELRHLDLDDIAQWSLKSQLLVISGFVLLLLLLTSIFFLLPQYEELQDLRYQQMSLEQGIQSKSDNLQALPAMKKQLEENELDYQVLLQQLPQQQEFSNLLSSINHLGKQNYLTWQKLDWDEKETQDFLYRLPLNIELMGSYQDIGRFSEAIAKLSYVINFSQVEWKRIKPDSEFLRFRARAYSYQLIKPFVAFYSSSVTTSSRYQFPISVFQENLPSPFSLPFTSKTQMVREIEHCKPLDKRNQVQPLERFDLDELTLVGVMAGREHVIGVIQTPTGTVDTVFKGQFLGLEQGEVVEIGSDFLIVREVGLDCRQVQETKLSLSINQ
ncbi:MAG: pilus assembly protein PilP [Vibrio sp.]